MPVFVTLTADVQPSWRVRAGEGLARTTTDIPAVVDVPLVMLLRSDVEVDFQIPAMRIKTVVAPGVPSMAWFMPKRSGTYPVIVATPSGRRDGTVTVVA